MYRADNQSIMLVLVTAVLALSLVPSKVNAYRMTKPTPLHTTTALREFPNYPGYTGPESSPLLDSVPFPASMKKLDMKQVRLTHQVLIVFRNLRLIMQHLLLAQATHSRAALGDHQRRQQSRGSPRLLSRSRGAHSRSALRVRRAHRQTHLGRGAPGVSSQDPHGTEEQDAHTETAPRPSG
jgi:hypothetical protein